jgi:hypothetical protein
MFLKIAYEYSLGLEKSNEPKYIVLNGIGLAILVSDRLKNHLI